MAFTSKSDQGRLQRRPKKESTAHPKAKRCFPEGKEAWCFPITVTLWSPPVYHILRQNQRRVSRFALFYPALLSTENSRELLSVNKSFIFRPALYTVGTENPPKDAHFTGLFFDFSALRKPAGFAGHASFTIAKLTLAVRANDLILLLLPLKTERAQARCYSGSRLGGGHGLRRRCYGRTT